MGNSRTKNNGGNQNIIVYVGKLYGHMVAAIREYEKKNKRTFRIAFLYDQKSKRVPLDDAARYADILIPCDTSSPLSIQTALRPYQDELLAITCRGEDYISTLARIVPHVPYLRTATTDSLLWSTDKLLMRRRLFIHNKKITPAYTVVSDTSKESLDKIKKKVGFPLVVKPSGLAASRLVTICFHQEELEATLKKIFRKIKKVYTDTGGNWEPKILVEQFMDGEMYSIDAYVTSRGKVHLLPMVHVKTGRAIGFDDFFGYMQITPTILKKESIAAAEHVATQAVHAMGLRSTTAHIELMKTEDGWKVIELGPRVGGFRQMMYDMSFGINHTVNDVLVRIPEKLIIPKKIKGYTVAMKFFAKKEGKLIKLSGLKRAQELASFKKVYIHKKLGDTCMYAKHGGSSVFDIILFNPSRSELLADIRRLEQAVKIETE